MHLPKIQLLLLATAASANAAIFDMPFNTGWAYEKARNASRGAYEGAAKGAEWSYQNPLSAAAAVVGVAGAAVVAAPVLASAPVLAAAGFGAGGVQASSVAALVHSTIGNVAAGSYFAIAQSAGAGGAGLAAVNAGAQAGGAFAATSGGAVWLRKVFCRGNCTNGEAPGDKSPDDDGDAKGEDHPPRDKFGPKL